MSRFPNVAAAVAEGAVRADQAAYYEGVCARRPEYGRKLVEALRGDVRKRGVQAVGRRVTFAPASATPASADLAAGAAAIAAAEQRDAEHDAHMRSMGSLGSREAVVRSTAPTAQVSSPAGPLPFDMSRPAVVAPPTAPGAVTPLASTTGLTVEEQRAEWAANAARAQRTGHRVAPFRPRVDLASRQGGGSPPAFTLA